MPYVSKKQQAWAHTPSGVKALGGTKKVAEWDAASKGKKLPVRAGDAPGMSHAMTPNVRPANLGVLKPIAKIAKPAKMAKVAGPAAPAGTRSQRTPKPFGSMLPMDNAFDGGEY